MKLKSKEEHSCGIECVIGVNQLNDIEKIGNVFNKNKYYDNIDKNKIHLMNDINKNDNIDLIKHICDIWDTIIPCIKQFSNNGKIRYLADAWTIIIEKFNLELDPIATVIVEQDPCLKNLILEFLNHIGYSHSFNPTFLYNVLFRNPKRSIFKNKYKTMNRKHLLKIMLNRILSETSNNIFILNEKRTTISNDILKLISLSKYSILFSLLIWVLVEDMYESDKTIYIEKSPEVILLNNFLDKKMAGKTSLSSLKLAFSINELLIKEKNIKLDTLVLISSKLLVILNKCA